MAFPHNSNSKRGVTFLELMVVLIILGILAAVSLPNMMGLRSSSALKTAARTFAAAGMQARQSAIAFGHETELVIDLESQTWVMFIYPSEDQERRSRRRSSIRTEREMDSGQSSDEEVRDLPQRVTFGEISELGEDEGVRPRTNTRRRGSIRNDVRKIKFFPNGSSSGVAVEFVNDREKSLTVDFDRASGRPDVYAGEPMTMAEKLRDMGLNPADYGIEDDSMVADGGREPGEGFTRIGWDEDERVDHYESVAERLMNRAQKQYTEENQGPAAAYQEAGRWGGR